MQIDANQLIDVLQGQRNEAQDNLAKMTAYARELEQRIQKLQEEKEEE